MWSFSKNQEQDIKKSQEKAAKNQLNAKGIKMTPQQLQIEANNAVNKILQVNSSSNWEKTDDKPCAIYKMKIENRLVCKGEANIKVNMKIIEQHIDNQKNYLPDNLSQNKVILKGEFGQVKYRRHKAKWPVDDRDFVLIKHKKRTQNQLIIVIQSINYDVPIEKGVIRGDFNIGGFIIDKISQSEVKVIHIADLDFKGSIPGIIKKIIAQAQGKLPAKFKQALQKK